MFQYRVEEELFSSDTLQIYSGVIKATNEEIEITAIKRDCYKYDNNKIKIEKYLKSLRDILTMIDIFASKIFPIKNNGEWLIIIETKEYYNLTDFILNNIEIKNNNLLSKIDILLLIYELISTILIFTDCENININYQRLMPQNIFISEYNKIYLKFPYWLLLNTDNKQMKKLKLNFSESYRYYLPPHLLLDMTTIPASSSLLLCNMDIWSLGCCIAEIFYGIPLFSSINISDQLIKMFTILRYPNWDQMPWKYCEINDDKLKELILIENNNTNKLEKDSLDKIISNKAMVELLRCCLQYTSEKQISLDQLSVFLDIFQINNKTENKQHALTFKHINNNKNNNNNNNNNNETDLIMIGSSTFTNEWLLLSQEKDKQLQQKDTQQKDKQLQQKNTQQTDKQQKGCQTLKIKTNNHSTNTPHKNNIDNNLNISDCVNILPSFNNNDTDKNNEENECNLLILEFSNICNMNEVIIEKENIKSFSFKYENELNNNLSSPIFNINNLNKVYIHIMINNNSDIQSLNTLDIKLLAHINNCKQQKEIGEMIIDITMLKQYKIIEGYYHIFNINNNKNKLGQVYIRVLPQFNISNISQCNESIITDDQSIVSNEGWKMFNKFVKNHA